MRGWTSMLVGFLLLGMAYWSFAADGIGMSAVLCISASAYFFFRGANGMPIGDVGDPSAVIDFIKDPADAIVDTATDRFADWCGSKPDSAEAEEQSKFDPDAVIARYLDQRVSQPAPQPEVAAPVRAFGRKGL